MQYSCDFDSAISVAIDDIVVLDSIGATALCEVFSALVASAVRVFYDTAKRMADLGAVCDELLYTPSVDCIFVDANQVIISFMG